MSENLWPMDFGVLAEKTPISILREQGQALGDRTSNIVVGRADTGYGGPGKFQHDFYLYCSPLAYNLHFLSVTHGIELYPAEMVVQGMANVIPVNTSQELEAHLREIFSRDRTKTIIASLIAQSKE
jgi:hypothetical protein